MKRLSEKYPLHTAYSFVFGIFLLRIIDVFIIRSDELYGEQILTKVVGLILVFAYVWSVKGTLAGIGLHAKKWKVSVLIGLSIMAAGLVAGYGVEWLYLYRRGLNPEILIEAQGNTLIPEYVAKGGLFFAITLLVGNIINSFMEEGLFRGILMTHLGSRMSHAKANIIQASLFGVWHIVWSLRDYLDGRITLMVAVGISAGYILLSGLIGFVWGYFYQKTNSLWASWSAHTLNNTVFNLVHITTSAGIPETLGLRVAVSVSVVVALLPLVRQIAKKWQLEGIISWC